MRANIPVLLKINANYPLRSNLTECAMSSPEHLQQAPDLIERNNDDYYRRGRTAFAPYRSVNSKPHYFMEMSDVGRLPCVKD